MSDNGKFVRADIGKLETFVSESEAVIKEFNEIKKEFARINSTLLSQWDGEGRAAYKEVVDHITEKVGSIESVLHAINENTLKDVIDTYHKADKELGEYNRTAGEEKDDSKKKKSGKSKK